jgi:hypothetical protein
VQRDPEFCEHFEDVDYIGSMTLEHGYFVNFLECSVCHKKFEEFGHHVEEEGGD